MIYKANRYLPHLHLDSQSLQRGLTWSLLIFIAVSLVSRLVQQAPQAAFTITVLAGIILLATVVVWQQRRIRSLYRRIHQVEQSISQANLPAKVKPISPSPVSHFDSDHLFPQGQTKH